MIDTRDNIKGKAYAELYEVIKRFSKQEYETIPKEVIKNIQKNMDKDYIWKYDNNKELEEQNFLVETKALIVELYERYLCPQNKKEFWNNYDRICLNMIEEKKKAEYNPENIFQSRTIITKEEIKNNYLPEKVKKDNLFKILFKKVKNFFMKKI